MTHSQDFRIFQRAVENLPIEARVLGDECLVVPPSPDYGYDATPLNALTFATMGVDGVHYALLTEDGVVRADSPVVEVCPMDSYSVFVIAESFIDYLATGCAVPHAEIQRLLALEADRGNTIVAFLATHFNQKRLWSDSRIEELTNKYLSKAISRERPNAENSKP